MNSDFILTTAATIEGYRITKQCGVVYGETVFQHGILASIGAKILNTIDSFKIWSREVDGSMSLIESARKFAYKKMTEEAKRRGANAIIAINSDNTFGENLMYLQLYGTAVRVVAEEQFEKEKLMNEAKLEEKNKKLEAHQQMLFDLESRRMNGEITSADSFCIEIEDAESMMQIWKIWQEYDFDDSCGEVAKLIYNAKEVERMYGRSSVNIEERKHKIKSFFRTIEE